MKKKYFKLIVLLAIAICCFFCQKTNAYTWEKSTVYSTGDVGWYTSIAVDSLNRPSISFVDATNTHLDYASWDGSSWNVSVLDSGNQKGEYNSLAFDSSNNPRISYYDRLNENLRYRAWYDSSWHPTIMVGADNQGLYTSLAIAPTGYSKISYYNWTSGDLEYKSHNGSSWDTEIVDSTGDTGAYTSLALDSSGQPHISYLDVTNTSLKYASWNGSSWDLSTVDNSGAVGTYSSLALDSQNRPRISYQDFTGGSLKFASWNGSSWDISIVDSPGSVGVTSLALDSTTNNPRIAYNDTTNYDLKFASWNGSTWNIDTIDSDGIVGAFASLALDSYNNPMISYYDQTNTNLKYAFSDILPPATTASPAGGTYTSDQSIALSATDTYSTISATYYTTDGSTPTTSSTVYSSPILITQDTTLKFFSVDSAGNSEAIKTETYIIDRTVIAQKRLRHGKKVYLYSGLDGKQISGQSLVINFTDLPYKLTKNSNYWIQLVKHKAYPGSLELGSHLSLKKYWLFKTNINKYKAKNSDQKFRLKIAYKYTKKELKLLKQNSNIKQKDLKIKYRVKAGLNWYQLNNQWKNAKIKHNLSKKKFTVKYFKKFPKNTYYFAIIKK